MPDESQQSEQPFAEDAVTIHERCVHHFKHDVSHDLHLISKRYSEHYDPCQEAANKSIKCIHRNPGQKDLCNDYFQYVLPPCARCYLNLTLCRAYRDCKKAWVSRRSYYSSLDFQFVLTIWRFG